MTRLNHDANNDRDIFQYFKTRARQVAADFIGWENDMRPVYHDGHLYYVTRYFCTIHGDVYSSFYIPATSRGNNLGKHFLDNNKATIVTVPGCNISEWLTHMGVTYRVAGRHTEMPEYKQVEAKLGDIMNFYGNSFLMDTVDDHISQIVFNSRINSQASPISNIRHYLKSHLYTLDS